MDDWRYVRPCLPPLCKYPAAANGAGIRGTPGTTSCGAKAHRVHAIFLCRWHRYCRFGFLLSKYSIWAKNARLFRPRAAPAIVLPASLQARYARSPGGHPHCAGQTPSLRKPCANCRECGVQYVPSTPLPLSCLHPAVCLLRRAASRNGRLDGGGTLFLPENALPTK